MCDQTANCGVQYQKAIDGLCPRLGFFDDAGATKGEQESTKLAPNFLIVDDHPLFLEALQMSLMNAYPRSNFTVATSQRVFKTSLKQTRYDLAIVSPHILDADGLATLRDSQPKAFGKLALIAPAMRTRGMSGKVKNLGAVGFVAKDQSREQILSAISAILRDEKPSTVFDVVSSTPEEDRLLENLRQLTPQQQKVLRRLCQGKLNKQIAFDLSVTETTVKSHVTSIFKKLNVHSRTQAVLRLQHVKNQRADDDFALSFFDAA